jgi:hypothetical protein
LDKINEARSAEENGHARVPSRTDKDRAPAHGRPKKKKKEHIPRLLDWGITLLIGLFLAIAADWLLGEEYASRQQAKVLAPVAGYAYGNGHRDDITVLLIDDASLEKLGLGWPAPYSYEARLLRAVGRYQPKAVFLDLYFKENRKAADIAMLVREICALKAQGTEVYLGATKDGHSHFGLRPELEEKAGTCFKKVALYFSPDDIDKTAWSYPVSPYRDADAKVAGINSAAVEIYNDLTKTPLVAKTPESKLALIWGSREAEHGIAWTAVKDGENTSEAYCREFQGIRELTPGGLRKFSLDDDEKPLCVFHDTMLAQDLSTNSAEEEALVDKQIRGKTVMIGVARAESRDLVLTPLHGYIPGVYLHAMALDNLLTYGANYPEEISLHFANNKSQWKLLFFLVAAIFLSDVIKTAIEKSREKLKGKLDRKVNKAFHAAHNARPKRYRWIRLGSIQTGYVVAKVLEHLLVALLVTAATGAMASLGSQVFHIGFISTFSIAMFVVAAEWLDIKKKLFEHLSPKKSTDEHRHSIHGEQQ